MPIGTSTVGSSPVVTGSVDEAAIPPDPQDGARYIDIQTRDYAIDPDTLDLERWPEVRQRVFLLVVSSRGSSTVLPELGTRFPDVIGESFGKSVDAEVRIALQRMVDDGVISVDSVEVNTTAKPGQARITVHYTDLESNTSDFVSF
jgi:hypothetical protein